MSDANVEAVINRIRERSEVGLQKYGTTTERTDLTTEQWLRHAQEEAMDLSIYLERCIADIAELREQLKNQEWAIDLAHKAAHAIGMLGGQCIPDTLVPMIRELQQRVDDAEKSKQNAIDRAEASEAKCEKLMRFAAMFDKEYLRREKSVIPTEMEMPFGIDDEYEEIRPMLVEAGIVEDQA